MSSQRDWPLERYPIAFHGVLEAGSGVIELWTLPWVGVTARARWYSFVKAAGDVRIWSVTLSGQRMVLDSRDSRGARVKQLLIGVNKTL